MSQLDDTTPAKILLSDSSRQQSRSAKIRQIVASQDSFDEHLSYPSRKEGLESPDIAVNSKYQVTPDEIFGPVSPRKGDNYNDDIGGHDKKTHRDQRRDQGSAKERMADNEGEKNKTSPRDHSLTSRTNDSEAQIKTHSRTESQPRDNTDSSKQTDTDHRQSPNQNQTRKHQDANDKDEGSFLKTSSVNVNRDNVNNIRNRLYRRRDSQNGHPSRASYNHTHILDDSLNISDAKLDNTLLRLFSRNSHNKENYSNMDNIMGYAQSDFIGLEPVMWRVHPMNATHKETLTREMDFIAFHIKPREIISRLYKDGILTPMDYNQLIRTDGQGDKAVTRLMIKILQRRGSKAYPALINALLASDYFFVCERLTDSEHGLRNGVLTDRAESEWRRLKNGLHHTPYRIHTPYTSAYTFDNSAFPFHTSPSSNQNFTFNETWPMTNQRSLIDHVSPLHNSMPLNGILTPVDVLPPDFQPMGNHRFDQRLSDLDAAFRLIQQDLVTMRAANQNVPHDHVTSTTRDEVLVTRADRATDLHYLDQKLIDLKARVTELTQYVAALKTERSRGSTEPASSNLRASSESHNPSPANQVIYHHHLEHQMRNLKVKMKELREEVQTLKTAKVPNSLYGAKQPKQGSSMTQKESVEGYRVTDAEKLDDHLRALRREINMLHDDVTALKMARSTSSQAEKTPNSTFRSTRNTPHRTPGYYSDDYLSPTRQYRSTETAREKSDLSVFNVIPGPLPHSPGPRYPSRYSPRDVNRSWDPERGRSLSRADSVAKSPGNKKATSNRSPTRNSDKQNSKSRNSSFYKDDTSFNEKDVKDKSYKDDNRRPMEDYKSNPRKNDDIPLEDDISSRVRNDDNSKRNYNNKIFGSEDSMAVSDSDNILPYTTHQTLDSSTSNQPYKPHTSGEDTGNHPTEEHSKDFHISHRSESLDNNDDKEAFHEKRDRHETSEDFKLGNPKSDQGNEEPLKSRQESETDQEDDYSKDGRTLSTPVATYVEDRPSQEQARPVPIIVIPEEKFTEAPEHHYNQKNTPDVPGEVREPGEKKKVRYDDTALKNTRDKHRSHQERPMSRAAYPADYRRVSSPRDRRDLLAGTSRRPVSPANSISSENSEYVPLTTPTRILSPPHDTPFERVTTPYKILTNPNRRKVTTWSKKTDRKGKLKGNRKITSIM